MLFPFLPLLILTIFTILTWPFGHSTLPTASSRAYQYTSVHIITRQFTSVHISTHQYTSVHISSHQFTSAHISPHQYTSLHISTNQYTSVRISQLYPTQLFESWSSQKFTFEKLPLGNFNFSMGMKSYFRWNRKVMFYGIRKLKKVNPLELLADSVDLAFFLYFRVLS